MEDLGITKNDPEMQKAQDRLDAIYALVKIGVPRKDAIEIVENLVEHYDNE